MTVHAWLPDRRSLCGRRERLFTSGYTTMSTDEKLAVFDADDTAPICGACVVMLDVLRGHLAVMEAGGRPLWPDTPAEGVRILKDTLWAFEFDTERVADDIATEVKDWGILSLGYDKPYLKEAAAVRKRKRADSRAKLAEQTADGSK
ncbi:hypothetical protein [Subtercola endophyticus]|uniref:hypothetical protein n=1 Tax=Subtercola endophyticus TaxID=2895559 RepID=UPI001E2A960B|nr:hypothetical protein [Subtercola endophyticus]UFS58939.1 hypothetical protein LQ955_18410 [Subtercola endophyticus]